MVRRDDEALRERLENEYALSENQAIYKRRQEKVELVFGHIKRNLGVTSFLLRGREGARAETSLLCLCFNLRHMMTLLGIKGLIQKIREKAKTVTSGSFIQWATSATLGPSHTLLSRPSGLASYS